MAFFEKIIRKLYKVLTNRLVYHTLFWLGVLVLMSLVEYIINRHGFFFTLSNNAVRLMIFGAAIYYNIYFLVPRHLAHKKFGAYFGYLVLIILIVSPLESLILYVKADHEPGMQAAVLSGLHWSFVTNFFVVGTSTVVKITVDWLKNQRERQELQTETMQSELRFLKSQINPHFLFNTLNSLYALTLKKSDLAPDIVLKLSEMMRYMLYECNERWVPLHKEISYIRNYLELERLRQGGYVDIKFDVDGLVSDQQIAPLMFIPFIENSFKHGVGHHISKGFVHIKMKVSNSDVKMFIENSKPETLPKPVHPRSGGIGLVNVRRRLDLLYPHQYKLHIENSPKSYGVYLEIVFDVPTNAG